MNTEAFVDYQSAKSRPAFLVTLDTEGDNLWARTAVVETRNARFLPRFQRLCEKYGVRPTWLTTWEMANSPVFQEFARDVLARDAGEIGMHLHAWNSPPIVPLTEDDYRHHPYLNEFPEALIREKMKVLTGCLEETFGHKMISHRAGRFSFDETCARILVENGYRVDGSVTPGVSWRGYPGDPKGVGGMDFRRYPEEAYFLDLKDIRRPGYSPLLEVPVTIMEPRYGMAVRWAKRNARKVHGICARAARLLYPDQVWLYPKGYNNRHLTGVLKAVLHSGRQYAEFMMHSSELMPGGSPNFPSARSIEELYATMEELFAQARERFVPVTMGEFYERVQRERACVGQAAGVGGTTESGEKRAESRDPVAVMSNTGTPMPVAS
jgi:hypothetical protein